MKYQHKENGKVIEILDFNEKTKVYLIRFVESGKETNITSSTLKRWYIQIQESEVEESEKPAEKKSRKEKSKVKAETVSEPPQVEEKPAESEEQAGDGTPLSQVGKEIAEQAKEKAKKVKSEKKKVNPEKKVKTEIPDINDSIQTILKAIENAGMIAKIYDNDIRTITVKNGSGNCLGEIHVGKQKFVMAFRTKFVPEGFQADRIRNCMNSHAFDIPYTEMDKFSNMMNAVKEVK